jgi:hypothetical protein
MKVTLFNHFSQFLRCDFLWAEGGCAIGHGGEMLQQLFNNQFAQAQLKTKTYVYFTGHIFLPPPTF